MFRNIKFLVIFSVITSTGCFSGCQPLPEVSPIEKDGKWYGVTRGSFRHRWWDYYERGLSFADGKFWKEAETAFRRALNQKYAKKEDERGVRTYGLRFIIDYFPHRELGIVLSRQKRHLEAIKELETSLSSVTSAKAQFYLDKARKAWIEQEGLDIRRPEIVIKTPAHEAISNRLTVTVTGSAKDDSYVKKIWVNGIPVRIDLAKQQVRFKVDVPLGMGSNRIVVEAEDLTGKTGRSEREMVCDRTGPVLNIDEIVRISPSDDRYLIRGYAHDRSGIRRIRVNGQEIVKGLIPEIVLEHHFNLSSERETVVVTAEDIAGNWTRAHTLKRELIRPGSRSDLSASSGSRLFASLDSFSLAGQAPRNRGFTTPEHRIDKKENELGNYHALIIGINDYNEWDPLKNAVNDARALRDILTSRYGFLPENILFRTDKDAIRDRLMSDLACLTQGLRETDNLLVYFAGHGQLDETTGDGYWIPVDGEDGGRSDTWISNFVIQRFSEKTRAKNVIVISDSCFSESLLYRDAETYPRERISHPESEIPERISPPYIDLRIRGNLSSGTLLSKGAQEKLLTLASKRSRQVISSGGMKPIPDQGKSGHSPFAHHLLNILRKNKKQHIDMEALFYGIGKSLAEEGDQRPKFGRLKTDMNGQFVLRLSDNKDKQGDSPTKLTQYCESFSDTPRTFLDDIPPVIGIRGWAEKKQATTYHDEIFLELRVRDESGIREIKINRQEIMKRSGGRNIYLNHPAELKAGDNRFLIKCVDQFGNWSEQEILVHRKLKKIYESGSRMSVLLFPFEMEGTGLEIENKPLEDFVKRRLLADSDYNERFNKKPSAETHPRDPDDVCRLARKIGAEFALMGKIISKGNESLDISVQMIEAETPQVVVDPDVYEEVIDEEAVRKLCHGLVTKLCDALPLVEGRVVKVKGKKVITDLGKIHQVKKGMRLIFFQEESPVRDPDTGEVLDRDVTELGTGRIQNVLSKISHTEVLDMDASELEVRHRVITK